VGQTLAEANLRATTGVYVIAIMRGSETIYNPPAQTRLNEGDLIGFMGDHSQMLAMDELLAQSGKVVDAPSQKSAMN
jgi:CPA2 family monovalent cation:H+ antiporter-2